VTLRRAAIVSFRLGGTDGVSVEAAKWADAMVALGLEVTTVAGEGTADRIVAGLGAWSDEAPDVKALHDALDDADVVVAENICSLPLNRRASDAVAAELAGRPAILHHHDLPWQRPVEGWPGRTWPVPDDPHWLHVTVNDLSRRQLEDRQVGAVVERNRFSGEGGPGDRDGTRDRLGIGPDELVVLQPTRAIARKNVPGGLALAEAIGASYWLTGQAEEDYAPELERLVRTARVRVLRGPVRDPADAYAACDLVVLPSHWEGFGNPSVEGWLHGRLVAVGAYPVADELRALGFRWLDSGDAEEARRLLAPGSAAERNDLIAHNRDAARRHLDLAELPERLRLALDSLKARFSCRGTDRARTDASGGAPTASPAGSAVTSRRSPGGAAPGAAGTGAQDG